MDNTKWNAFLNNWRKQVESHVSKTVVFGKQNIVLIKGLIFWRPLWKYTLINRLFASKVDIH